MAGGRGSSRAEESSARPAGSLATVSNPCRPMSTLQAPVQCERKVSVETLSPSPHITPSLPPHPSPPHPSQPLLDALEDKPKFSASQNLVLALYTYNATSADELSFHKGSVLNVQSKEGDWWRGELNGQVGLFPSNYVQLLNEQQAPTSDPTRCESSQ